MNPMPPMDIGSYESCLSTEFERRVAAGSFIINGRDSVIILGPIANQKIKTTLFLEKIAPFLNQIELALITGDFQLLKEKSDVLFSKKGDLEDSLKSKIAKLTYALSAWRLISIDEVKKNQIKSKERFKFQRECKTLRDRIATAVELTLKKDAFAQYLHCCQNDELPLVQVIKDIECEASSYTAVMNSHSDCILYIDQYSFPLHSAVIAKSAVIASLLTKKKTAIRLDSHSFILSKISLLHVLKCLHFLYSGNTSVGNQSPDLTAFLQAIGYLQIPLTSSFFDILRVRTLIRSPLIDRDLAFNLSHQFIAAHRSKLPRGILHSLLSDLAKRGDSEAFFQLGSYYQLGLYGFIKDLSQAMKNYQRGVDLQNGKAMVALALCYHKEKKGPAKQEKILQLLQKAADLGLKEAFFYLGKLYETGIYQKDARKPDLDKARHHYLLAGENGFGPAFLALGDLEKNQLLKFKFINKNLKLENKEKEKILNYYYLAIKCNDLSEKSLKKTQLLITQLKEKQDKELLKVPFYLLQIEAFEKLEQKEGRRNEKSRNKKSQLSSK